MMQVCPDMPLYNHDNMHIMQHVRCDYITADSCRTRDYRIRQHAWQILYQSRVLNASDRPLTIKRWVPNDSLAGQ